MKKIPAKPIRKNSSGKISDSALTDFLVQLADLYDVKESGNPPLADALRKLAKSIHRKTLLGSGNLSVDSPAPIKRGSFESKFASGKSSPARRSKISAANKDVLKSFNEKEIRDFLMDETKTKEDLLDLASARFSIPISQLKRLKISEVRQTVLSALLHESSIEIISEEAKREGRSRLS